ncbi:hypothetical protein DXG01_003588 [Tephrocybe rancida]|nr:hypothetical protein DXG01_003588 [Tephrocybe rancida]
MLLSKACDVKGIVALACAWHGCFIPTCVADLPAGEQQKNVDYILRELFHNGDMDEVRRILFMYDIVCQYIIHLEEHLGPDLPQHITIDQAIGLMHVHGHKDECYRQFVSLFIPGAAITAGEILETLWASLNKVSSQARTATLAHRAKILYDHMSDNNWKKIINMPALLCRKYTEATEMSAKAQKYHDDMIKTLNITEKEGWDKEIEKAEVDRLQDYKAMDIMRTRDVTRPAAMVDGDQVIARGRNVNEDWMLDIEDRAWRLLRHPREEDRKAVMAGRERLASQITMQSTLQASAGYVMSDLEQPPGEPNPTAFDNLDGNDGSDDADSSELELETTPEDKVLALPSTSRPLVSPLRNLEIMLRVEQADRYLQNLRALIAEKSFLYTHVIHAKTIKAVMTRARGVVAGLNFTITSTCRGYSRCRASLVALATPSDILNKYCKLNKANMKSSTALLTPNIAGSMTLRLSWIWLVDSLNPGDSPESLRELLSVAQFSVFTTFMGK